MSWREHRRPNLSLQATLTLLEEEGGSVSRCLADTGLSVGDLLNVDTRISDAVEITVLSRALAQLPPKAGYGLRVGQALRVTTFGIWGMAILSSPTLRNAFELMTRFSEHSLTLSSIQLEETSDSMRVVMDMQSLPPHLHLFLFERYYAASATFLKEMWPDLDMQQTVLETPLTDESLAEDLSIQTKRCVRTNCPAFALVSPRALLDRPLPQADPLVHAHFIGQCQAMLNQSKRLDDHGRRVRDYMVQNDDYSPKLERVAQHVGLSPRTFRRRLKAEGLVFSQLVLETRMTLARELLSTARLSVSAVSERLGYAETASFSRAYSRYWGRTPIEDR